MNFQDYVKWHEIWNDIKEDWKGKEDETGFDKIDDLLKDTCGLELNESECYINEYEVTLDFSEEHQCSPESNETTGYAVWFKYDMSSETFTDCGTEQW